MATLVKRPPATLTERWTVMFEAASSDTPDALAWARAKHTPASDDPQPEVIVLQEFEPIATQRAVVLATPWIAFHFQKDDTGVERTDGQNEEDRRDQRKLDRRSPVVASKQLLHCTRTMIVSWSGNTELTMGSVGNMFVRVVETVNVTY